MKQDFNNKVYVFNTLINQGYFTRKELELAIELLANDLETLNRCIWVRYMKNNLKELLND
jgi:hypothetical protein